MPKKTKSQSPAAKSRHYYTIQPWECRHQKDHTEIVAYVEASGKWETVFDVRNTSGAGHETMALFLINIIHEHQKKRDALRDAIEALELVLHDGLTFTSEQAAEHAVSNIRKVIA